MKPSQPFDLEKEIQAIFADYVKIPSYTNTPEEKQVAPFLKSWFQELAYFKKHPQYWGAHTIQNDPLNRHVIWGMVKGKGEDTIVLIHHYDVVETEDYEAARPFAHDVHRINHEIRSMIHKFDREAIADLESNQWQFGRGSADMKAGGAIQLALLKKYTHESDFTGNVIVLCLPDEENLSAGMRSAVDLLYDLKEQFHLKYQLMINGEPHQSPSAEYGFVYEGSVGKLMPMVYARGSLAHVGRIFEGLNPLHLMSQLVVDTELNMDFSDISKDEATPPPSWLYLKDQKIHYDVSIPTKVWAYLSVLTMDSQPDAFIEKLKLTAEHAFATVIQRMNRSYKKYLGALNQPSKKLPWQVNVKTFSELFQEVSRIGGDSFICAYQEKQKEIDAAVAKGNTNLIESSFELIELCLQFSRDTSPLIVIGLSPPYYPGVTNQKMPDLPPKIQNLSQRINQFSMEQWQQPYLGKRYYTGISDLSYSTLFENTDSMTPVAANMPLWGNTYQIPFEKIRKIKMPCMNIGPWGKDFHKLTERVLIEDLFERTPKILNHVIKQVLQK
jgi:arginine utilization protein RocB